MPPKGPPIEPHAKVWFERSGKVALSDWRVELLQAVERTGSLSGAAEHMGVPYRTAWYKLKDMEEQLGVRLLQTSRGGTGGGGSRLTEEARAIVARFEKVSRGVHDLVQKRFEAEFGEGSPT
jgi:molybdate transport repressor ModE-like protein